MPTTCEVAATTAEDLAVLAPRVPVAIRSAVADADPTLDDDVTAWFSDRCDRPRLTLLGPVGVRAHGSPISKRKPYYTELLTYLATRPHGATPEEVADAFSITGPRVRNDVKSSATGSASTPAPAGNTSPMPARPPPPKTAASASIRSRTC